MSVDEIKENSSLRIEVAKSLFWHSFWFRHAPSDAKVKWGRLLLDKDYILGKSKKCMKNSS